MYAERPKALACGCLMVPLRQQPHMLSWLEHALSVVFGLEPVFLSVTTALAVGKMGRIRATVLLRTQCAHDDSPRSCAAQPTRSHHMTRTFMSTALKVY